MQPFSLDHLNETEFEEFCYDLLKALGFENLNWRKGTGLSSSPSDQGRDIECQLLRKEVDGSKYFETWFVECKHYKRGVPSEKILGALTWATLKKPDKLLFIVSNFFSNPTKIYIDEFIRDHNPSFRILLWERKILEELASGKSDLLKKYNILNDFSLVSIMHPSHVSYFRSLRLNSLDYLFEQLDKLGREARKYFLSEVHKYIMNYKKTDEYVSFDYEFFKKHCYDIVVSGAIDQRILTFFIVSYILQSFLMQGDTKSIELSLAKEKASLPKLRKKLEDERFKPSEFDQEIIDLFYRKHSKTGTTPDNMSDAEIFIDMFQKLLIDPAPERAKVHYDLYIYFCEVVVEKLLLESYLYV